MKVRGTLKKNSDFRRLYAKGRSAVTPYLILYVRPNRLGENRVGYTVSADMFILITVIALLFQKVFVVKEDY